MGSLVKELDTFHVDYFHIDCNDDPTVFQDIEKIRSWSATPIDLHIISDDPEKYFDKIQQLGVESVQIQYENLKQPIHFPKSGVTQWGLAILPNTPLDVIAPYLEQLDFALLMTTTPGMSGGQFKKENFQAIRSLRRKYPSLPLHVDGGVNDEVSFVLRNLGVRAVVSGSYLVNHDSIGRAMLRLKTQEVGSSFLVQDIMIGLNHLPIIKESQIKVETLLRAVEDYNLGFALITDDDNKLTGFCSNADIRRGLLNHLEDFNSLTGNEMVNRSPITVLGSTTLESLIAKIQALPFAVNYLPVTDTEGTLLGALTFQNLIKGEL